MPDSNELVVSSEEEESERLLRSLLLEVGEKLKIKE
jgi:hypothetical protein